MFNKQPLLTAQEVADLLRVRTSRVYDLVRLGLLPGVRLGRQVRIDPGALRTWIEQGGSATGSGSPDDSNQDQ